MYLEALRNPFFRQQMMVNQQLTGLLGKNGVKGGLPPGLLGGFPGNQIGGGNPMQFGGFPGSMEGENEMIVKGKRRKGKRESGKGNKEQELQLQIEIQVNCF